MELENIVYPNQPLVDVVFEVRFPGEVRVECERHLFWEKIRDDYPNVLVPQQTPEKPLALMPYKFRKADGSMTVMVCMNSFAVSATIYPGFDEFSREVLKIYKLFGETFEIKKLNRVGWRYINIIPFVREKGFIPLARFLKIGLKLPESIPKEFKSLNLMFESVEKGVSVITQLQAIQRDVNAAELEEALLLDFDFGRVSDVENELKFKNVPEYMHEAHVKTRCLFEDFISDEYRRYLLGDVI
ncbi:MAG: TIGR04255 family protein [Gammaproteobacteria bacterium]